MTGTATHTPFAEAEQAFINDFEVQITFDGGWGEMTGVTEVDGQVAYRVVTDGTDVERLGYTEHMITETEFIGFTAR